MSIRSSRRARGGVLAAAVLSLALAPASASAAATATVTTDQSFTPAFDPAVLNYTTHCVGNTVTAGATAPSGTTVSIDRNPAASGTQTKVLTLKPGQRFIAKVKKGSKTTTHSIRCLPEDFPAFEATGTVPAAFPLFAFSNIRPVVFNLTPRQPYAVVADRKGVPIWWIQAPTNLFNVMGMKGGRIATGQVGGAFRVYRPNGTVAAKVTTPIGDIDSHEAIPTSRGTFYLAGTQQRDHTDLTTLGGQLAGASTADGSALDSVLQEVSASGKLLWSWKSVDHFALSETILPQTFIPLNPTTGSAPVMDIAHVNSLEDDGHGGIIASFRNTSAVYRIIKSTGAIDWKLGGTTTSKSLRVIGDDANAIHLQGQHDARVLPDGTITISDNGSRTQGFVTPVIAARKPRATRWRIDPVARTATLVESLADPTIGESLCCGSARRGSDGSWLVGWGAISYIRAYDRLQRQVFSLHLLNGGFSYRATPIPASQVKASALISGMDAMNRR